MPAILCQPRQKQLFVFLTNIVKNKISFVIALLLVGCCLPVLSFAQTHWHTEARLLVAKMTLEEKAAMCSGKDYWSTYPIERLGIPSISFADGPHGLRKADGGDITKSVAATCFPTASALASTWNEALIQQMGIALGNECLANNAQVLLGPGVNMKRSPLGGRNFEYFSEDPVLSGKIAAAFINGVQSKGVGTSLKHFAANNQEFERTSNNSVVDEQTLNEIYLRPFEIAVKESQPWTVMSAYNKLNGTLASENKWLLDSILVKQWGFKGIVMSDWGAVDKRPNGIDAGLHIEMPGNDGVNNGEIIKAINNGSLSTQRLDEIVTSIIAVVLQSKSLYKATNAYDSLRHQQLAREISAEAIVLLKNDDKLLPLSKNIKVPIALIGSFAKTPRYQGSGSSLINPTKLLNVYDELKAIAGNSLHFTYSAGYKIDAGINDSLVKEAVANAKKSGVAIIFAGLPDSYESEGFDRTNIHLPQAQNELIEAVVKVQPNTIVVLMNGSAVSMPWAAKVKTIVEAWLGGQSAGGAIADVLLGKTNPSGRLSETFPVRLEDTPAYLDFPGKNGTAIYGEKIFTGYRYYDKKNIEPLFPFGHGLSYSNFQYKSMESNVAEAVDTAYIKIDVTLKNTSNIAGKEVVQMYIRNNDSSLARPVKELKHFAKVQLQPGEEKKISFVLNYRDFAWFNSKTHNWQTSNTTYTIMAGGSSAVLPLQKNIFIKASAVNNTKLNRYSMMKEFAGHPKGKLYQKRLLAVLDSDSSKKTLTPAEQEMKDKAALMLENILKDLPVYKLIAASNGRLTEEQLAEMLQQINE